MKTGKILFVNIVSCCKLTLYNRTSTRSRLLFLILGAFIAVIISCDRLPRKVVVSKVVDQTILFDSLVAKAASFVPVAGKSGGTLRLPLYKEPETFNPISGSRVIPFMYEGLTRVNGATGKTEPCLAVGWEASADSLAWTFFLRRNVCWSDGQPFTAYDVDFTYGQILNPKNSSRPSYRIFHINGMPVKLSVVDSFTVRFVLPVRFMPLLESLTQEIVPRHLYKPMAERGSFLDSMGILASPLRMAGTGPFTLVEYLPFNRMVLVKNKQYWRKDTAGTLLPYLDTILFRKVGDLEEGVRLFKANQLDYLPADGNDYFQMKNDTGIVSYLAGPECAGRGLVLNLNQGTDSATRHPYVDSTKLRWFTDPLFRKALAYAINKRVLIDSILCGFGYEEWGPLSPSDGSFYNPGTLRYPYCPDSSKNLLARMGCSDINGDSILEDVRGLSLAWTITIPDNNVYLIKTASFLCADFKKVGCQVKIDYCESELYAQLVYFAPYSWDMILTGYTTGTDPSFLGDVWRSSGAYHAWYPSQQKPYYPFEQLIDSLFDRAQSVGKQERKQIFNQWQLIASDALPIIYTIQSQRILCISKRVKNVNPSPVGGILHDIELLYLN